MATEFLNGMKRAATSIGIALDDRQIKAFERYQEILATENKTTNLTALPIDKYVDEHFADSLTLCLTGKFAAGQKVADIGAGAGFPGVPLKIAFPDIELHLIEANRKKASFLQKLVAELELKQVFIHCIRAEEAARQAQLRENMDVVVARAVASLPVLLEYALPLCRVGGWFLAMKGPKLDEEIEPAKMAALELGGKVSSVITPFENAKGPGRVIVLVEKNRATGARYPRRPGVPAKRPLGD